MRKKAINKIDMRKEKNMFRIEKWSYGVRVLFQIILVGIPVVALLRWVVFDREAIAILDGLRHRHYLPEVVSLSYGVRWVCFGIAMIGNLVAMFGFYHLVKLFKLYEKGQIFTQANIKEMKMGAYTIFVWCIANFFTSILLVLALTINNPVGQRILSISLDTKDFSTLVVGIIAIVIVQIMEEARKIKDEYDYIV